MANGTCPRGTAACFVWLLHTPHTLSGTGEVPNNRAFANEKNGITLQKENKNRNRSSGELAPRDQSRAQLTAQTPQPPMSNFVMLVPSYAAQTVGHLGSALSALAIARL
ncbi:hypothetical protein B0J18DRAFT_44994 [Chaetomium sp. MPI-SDFR-AT-0129]|nr:hypothetical protein B0J18DRAFT_44994 [Chaetomium sp. MPI-SDFR-AT-0129]